MRSIAFPDGVTVPALGQGTWQMGETPDLAADEIAALQAGIEAGMVLIDTAEMYGDGATETLVGKAIAGRRDKVFLCSKAYPQNTSRHRLQNACEDSLRRLGTDRLDLYLVHWKGTVPLAETVAAMEALVATGRILRWGVSNFDTNDMDALIAAGGDGCVTNQVLYNVSRRGPEYDLVPWLDAHRMPLMAYSPVEQGRLPEDGALGGIAKKHNVSAYQVALAWVMRHGAIAIPKAGTVAHVKDNRGAAELKLSDQDLALIDAAFRPPSRKQRLAML